MSSSSPLTVITNFLPVITRLTGETDICLISLGGKYYPWANAFLGPATIQLAEQIHSDY